MKLYIHFSLSVEEEEGDFLIVDDELYDDTIEVDLDMRATFDKSDDVPKGWWNVEIERKLDCGRMEAWEQALVRHIEKEMKEGRKFEEIEQRFKQYLDAHKPAPRLLPENWR